MTEKKTPIVSIITLLMMICGVIITGSFFDVNVMSCMWIVWAICIAALFLGECLIGLIKKRFSSNIGAFVATAIMTAVFIVSLLQNSPRGSSLFDFSGLARALISMAFLPPMIVSFAANIGNVIYKLTRRKPMN